MKRNAPRVKNPARLARLRDQAIKLRERVKLSTHAFHERNQARFTWWQRAFGVPMVADWAIFTKAKTLLSAFMALLGLATSKRPSLFASLAEGPAPKVENSNKRRLYAEGLEPRLLMAFGAEFELSSLTGANGFQINGELANDQSGRSVSDAGDINGDGIDDLIIGADTANPNGTSSGASYVVFGSSTPFAATLELSSLTGANGFQINGEGEFHHSGRGVSAAGDINGDGIDDLIIGSYGASPNGSISGASYVVFGSRTPFAATLELSSLTGANGFQINGEAADDRSGSSVSAAGDINGDGIDDLIVGAPDADSSYVVFGSRTAFGSNMELSSLTGANGFQIIGESFEDFSGFSVSAAGDINGDGIDDLIVGAFFADPNGNVSGASYVVFGSRTAFGPTLELSSLTGANGFQINGEAVNNNSGRSVSEAGDINGDGIDDLIVGAPGASPNGSAYSGASYVVFGSRTAFGPTLELSSLTGANGFQINGEANYDGSGISVSAAGDINGDGIDDLIVGANGASPNGSFSGASYVVFGSRTAFGPTLNLSSLTGPNGFQINGEATYDSSGFSVSAAGDINGDGIDDLILGAYRASPNGTDYSGASYVVFGQPAVAPTPFDANLNLSALTGPNGFQISGELASDYSGRSVSDAGDINGDGIDDLIIGAYIASPNGIANSGASYVVFGSRTAFAANLNLSSLTGANGFQINGEVAGDTSGISVSAAGDINGDGIDDLIIGARQADPNGNNGSGASYVVFGSRTAFAANLNLSSLTGPNGFQINGEVAGDFSGISVSAAGDINGDGIDDLIIGARGADLNGSVSGASYVVFGSRTAFAANLNLSSLTGTNGFQISGEAAYDYSGHSVSAAGDINGDGIDDLIIGAYFADPNGSVSGASYVVFGSRTAFAANLNLSSLTGTNGFQISGEAAYDYSGASVSAAGDINGDGIDDLIIGARGADLNGSNSGASYVVFGSRTAFEANLNLSSLTGANGFQINGEVANDYSGASVSAAGDINGDGIDDLIIGAMRASLNGPFSGASYVVFGSRTVFAANMNLSSLTGANGFQINGELAGDFAGNSVSASGDINGDGIDDLIIGAHRADPNGSSSGASYVVLGHRAPAAAAALPAVNLSVSATTGTEAGTTAITVTATAASAVSGAQTVSLAVTGTGISASDYALSNSTITIPDGATTGTVTFTVKDDLLNEGDETATLTISSPSAGISLGTTLTQNITITDDDNAGTSNYRLPATGAYRVVRNGSTIEIYNGTPVLVASRAMGIDPMVINGTSGNDSLTIDLSGGNFTVPITFNGESETSSPGDILNLTGGSFATGTFAFTNANDGTIDLSGNSQISYTGLEPIDTTGTTINDLILTFNGGAETITLTDASDAAMTIDSPLSESLTFANPTGSLTINAGTGDDIIDITSVDTGFNGALTVNGDAGNDTINLNADITLDSGKNLDLDLTNDATGGDVDAILIGTDANLLLAGTGTATLKASKNIGLASGSSVVTVDGDITISANQQAPATSGNFIGVDVNNGLIQSTGTGLVTVVGRGGDDAGGSQYGVRAEWDGDIIGNVGLLTVRGTGGNISGTGSNNHGVFVSGIGSSITSSGGAVLVEGTGGGSESTESGSNVGVALFGGTITAAGTGAGATLTVRGTGGTGTGWENTGVYLIQTSFSFITSSGGDVLVEGTGGGSGTGGGNHGVAAIYSGPISSTGTGATVTVRGMGGNTTGTGTDNYGVYVAGSTITSSGGAVLVEGTGGGAGASTQNFGVAVVAGSSLPASITSAGTMTVRGIGGSGTASNNAGVYVQGFADSATISSSGDAVLVEGTGGNNSFGTVLEYSGAAITAGNNAAVTLVADSMNLGGTINAGTGIVTLRQRTNGTLINLGDSDVRSGSPLTLGLDDAELDLITAGTINIGDMNSGAITVSANISREAAANFNVRSSVGTTVNSSVNLDSAGGTVSPIGSTLTVTGSVTGPVVVPSGSTLNGTGTITGNVSGGGTFSLGNGPGIMTIEGNFTPSGTVAFEVNPPATVAGTHYDQYVVNGMLNLSGATLSFTGSAVGVAANQLVKLIDNDATEVTASATNFASGATVTINGNSYKIYYAGGDGNDLVLVQATAPTTVYVDDNFTQSNGTVIADADLGTTGSQPAIFGVTAFSTINAALADVTSSGTIIVNSGTYAETVSLTGTRTMKITGPNSAQTVIIDDLTTIAGTPVVIEGSSNLTVGDSDSRTLAGVISGSGSFTKQGSGTYTLTASNLYTGATNINVGTLRIAGAPSAPAGAAAIFTFDSVSGATINNAGSAGVGKNGSLVAGSAVVGGGRSGNAMSTSGGTGARMDIASAGISLAGGNWTGAAWFNNLFTDGDWNTLFVDSNAADAQLIIEAGSNRLGSYVSNSFRPSPYNLVPAANSGWNHVAAVGSGSTTSFYRNGVLVGTANGKSVTNITSVGASPAGGGMQRFAQLIDDVYIYQSALTAADIMALYNSGAVTASNSIPDGSTVTIAGGAFLDLNGSSETIGSLAGAGTVTSGSAGSPTLTVGSGNGSGSFSGAVQNGAGTVSLAKTGAGAQTLAGVNTYSGATTISAGQVLVTGSTSASSSMTVNGTGTLGGTGTVNGTVNVASGGTVAPGLSPGVLNSGNVTLVSGSTFAVEIGGTTPGNAATNYDQLNVTGTVNLGSATLTTAALSSFVPVNGNTFTIINNDSTDAIVGTFNGLAEGASLSNFLGASGVNAFISYVGGTGNDVVIRVEPINTAPTAANSSVTTNEDFPYTFSAMDFNFSDTDSSDVLSAVKITTIESAGDLEWFNGSSWVDVTQDQEISKADIDASRLRFVPNANANGSPYATFGFKVKDTGGPVLSVAAYTLTITVSAINDVPAAQGSSVTTNEDIAKTFAVGDFLFTDVESDSLASITISSLSLASGDTLKLSGADVTVGQTITVADIPNLVYAPFSDANGMARSSFGFTANDAGNGTVAATMTINVTAVDDAPVLTINDTSTYVENAVPTIVAPNLTLTDPDGPNINGAAVSLTTNFNPAQDSLQFTNQNGISGSYSAATGILTLSGSASAAAYQTALRSVTYSNNSQNPTSGARSVQFSVGSSTLANPANGHFYEFVSAAGGSWASANAAASARTLFGLQGYLATVTSASENAFIAGKLIGQGWMGASDAEVEGTWRWVTGPEAGQQFWQGAGDGSAVNGMYNNWTPGEPNNFGPFGEDYAHFRVDNSWNDYRVDNGETAGYVVEYGGMPGDPTLLQLIGTSTVSVVAVNDAPSGANKTLTTNEDTQLTIVAADFGYSDVAEEHAFNRVQITTLPATGTLKLNGVAISAGDFVTKAELDANELTFDPVANASGSPYTSFTFQVEDDGGTDNGGVNLDVTPNTITTNVSAVNDAPSGANKTLTTNEDTQLTIVAADLGFSDAVEGHAFNRVKITTLPANGTLKLNGVAISAGDFVTKAQLDANQLTFEPVANATSANAGFIDFTWSGTVGNDPTIGGFGNSGWFYNGSQLATGTAISFTYSIASSISDSDPSPTAGRFAGGQLRVQIPSLGVNLAPTESYDLRYLDGSTDAIFADPSDGTGWAILASWLASTNPWQNVNQLSPLVSYPTPAQLIGTSPNSSFTLNLAGGNSLSTSFTEQLTGVVMASVSGSPYTAFTFQVEDDGGTDNGGVNLDVTPKTIAINVSAVNDVPVAQGSSVTTNEDTSKTFAVGDFLFTDVEDDSLASITISSLNLASGDTLKLSGADVTVGQTITAANIPNLVYAPFANANGAARSTFGFTANDASSGTVAATMTINVTAVIDVSIGNASVTEGGNLQFNVSLESLVDVDTVITYSTADGSATTADSDFASQTLQTLTIPGGQTTGTITIVTTADNKVELDEAMTVQLTGVNGVQFSGAASNLIGTGTIINNDVERSLRFVDPNPNPGNQFGATVVALSGGNVVITSPFDDAGGLNAGAVYLFNGATGGLISTLRGSKANDNVGMGGVTALSNGNYVVMSPSWDNGAVVNAGAVTLGSGTTGTGVIGSVSAANSLVGTTSGDMSTGNVKALSNGNYVVINQLWDNGTVVNAGAVTFVSGTMGVSGVISAANSLVGTTTGDIRSEGVIELTNGNYVVNSPEWNNGAVVNAGAVTFGSGTMGVSGAISATNSLVGSTTDDAVGNFGVTALSNGNYVVNTVGWDNGAAVNAGAVTFGSGTTGVSGAVSASNSLVGTAAADQVGRNGVTALSNGNYVVTSQNWNGTLGLMGAATFASGLTGISGPVSTANSLVGSKFGDQVGAGGATALSNGNYVVTSVNWRNTFGGVQAGAVTFGNGTTGIIGVVSSNNSLIGSKTSDRVGVGGVKALSNGNYVVMSPEWDNGATFNAGAVTFGDGTTGITGVVSTTNSLVGTTSSDMSGVTVTALSNGNYVVRNANWDNGAVVNAGAVTFGSGTTGVSGVVSATNSLVGTTSGDMASGNVTALSNGNYVVTSQNWDNGAVVNAGAVTFGSGTTGVSGAVSATNSLVGTRTSDNVGIGGVTALSNGNYVLISQNWDNGAVLNAGAATFGSGTTGVSGAISATNSLVGTRANDNVGIGGVTALSNGNYVVRSQSWDNGARLNAGAVTFGSGSTGVSGAISATNSAIGSTSNTGLQTIVTDDVYGYFIGRFVSEAGGLVRLGSQVDGFAGQLSLSVDGPNDGFAGVAGQLRPFTLSATSPSASVYQYSINWGDGSAIETISNAQPVTNVQHRFLLPGTFNPIVTVYDGFNTFETTIANVVILSNELQSGVLAIAGTDGGSNNDSIIVTRLDASSNVSIQINGKPLVGAPASLSVPAGGVRVYSGDGTDGLVVRGTAAADVVRISSARILFDDAVDIIVEHDASIETRRVESMGGDDTVHLDGGLSVVVDGGLGNDTIQSLASAATTWNVSGANLGTLSSGNQTTSFSNTETLRGSDSASDAFTVAATGSLSGSISGGSGSSIDRLSTLSRTASLNIALQSVSGLGQGFSEIESFVGSGSALTGPNSTNTWTVAGPGTGTLSSGESTYFFSGYSTLNGGTVNDTFRIPNGLVIALNGGLGSDTLEMTSTTVINRWDVTGAGIGSVGSSTLRSSFNGIERLVGSNDVVDQFNMTSTSSSIDFLDGGSGLGDTLSYSNTPTTVNIGASSATGVSQWVGLDRFAATAGTLIGATTSSTWNISGSNSGTVVTGAGSEARSYEFSGFSVLTGGAGNDLFLMPSTGSISTINGGSGIDAIDYSSRASLIRTVITAYDANSGATGNGTNILGFNGVESFMGSSVAGDLLQGPVGGMDWWVSGNQSGRLGGSGSTTSLGTFSGFDSLQGGIGVDRFTIEANGYLASINGGTGSVSDLLVGPNNDVVWQLTGVRSGTMTATGASGIQFSNISNLTGGSGADTFVFYNAGSVPGTLNPGGGENTLSYEFRSSNVAVVLVATPPIATSVGTLIDDETNNFAIVIGGNGNDVLVGSASRGTVLVGGPGDDIISGGSGRDIVIGGLGADILHGGPGQDIVIGGRVSFDTNTEGLRKIREEWLSTDREYQTRIDNLMGVGTGVRSNDIWYLRESTESPANDTLIEDTSEDTLWGDGDLDWLIGSNIDIMRQDS